VDGNVGGTLQALGHASAEQWLHGSVPWWNHDAAAGLPLAAEMQPASFFLPFILLLHFFDGVLYLKITLQVMTGLFTYACIRELRMARVAALAGAAAFEMNGTFAWFGDAPAFPGTFLPLLIFAIERARNRALADRAGGPLPLAAGMGWMLLAGFPETALMNGLLAAAWSLLAIVRTPARARLALFGKIAGGGLAGIALSAPAVLPFLDYLTQSALGPHDSVQSSSLRGGQALTLLLPSAFGPPYADWGLHAWTNSGGYLSPLIGLLAITSMLHARRTNTWRWLAFSWCFFWICALLGERLAHCIWIAFPGANQVQISRYAMPSIEFCATLLVAGAIDDWTAAAHQIRARLAACVFASLCAVAIIDAAKGGRLFAPQTLMNPSPSDPYFDFTVACAALTIVMAIMLLRRAPTPGRKAALVFVLAADLAVPFVLPTLAGQRHPRLDLSPIAYVRRHAGLSRTYSIGRQLNANYGTLFDIAEVNVFSLPLAARWANYVEHLDHRANSWSDLESFAGRPTAAATLQANRAAFEQAGVRYVLVPRNDDSVGALHDPAFRPVFEGEKTRIYEIPGAAEYFQIAGGPCTIAAKNRDRLNTDCTSSAHLVRLEMDFPGWHASLNGAKAPLSVAQDIFQQIELPAGHASIHFWYMPRTAPIAAALFALSVVVLATLNWPKTQFAKVFCFFFSKKKSSFLRS
jgi:hypothetical protein